MRRLYFGLSLLVLLAAWWLRTADLATLPPGLHFDESENLQRSWRVIQGYGLLPHFEGIPEPFDAILRAGFLSLAGVKPFNGRLFAVYLNLLGVAAGMAAARALYRHQRGRELSAVIAGLTLATLPPLVMVGRDIYAVNWIPVTTLLALTAAAWAWITHRMRYFVLTGLFTGLAVTFYLVGIAFVPAVTLILLVYAASRRFAWPSRRAGLILLFSTGVTLLPWLAVFALVPGWLTPRIQALTPTSFNPLANLNVLLRQIQLAGQPIFLPDVAFFPVYTPYTTAFLNPVLQVLLIIGVFAALWRGREPAFLTPLLVGGVMLLPNILSNEPEQAVRMAGVFGPLALLVGLGTGEVFAVFMRSGFVRPLRVAVFGAGLVLLLTGSVLYTRYHVWYHFREQPRLLADPTSVYSWAYYYHVGYGDLLHELAAASEAAYVPLDHLNTNLATALLRPAAFPNVKPYDGRALPPGLVMQPIQGLNYGLPETDHLPLQYGLALPATRELLILPPLSLDAAQGLQARLKTGDDITNQQGWLLGKKLTLTTDVNPFAALASDTPGEPLAVFDDRLELLRISAPPGLQPGEWQPVTLYWRLRERAGGDYFVRLQTWDYQGTGRGTQNDRDGLMFRYLYPTVMWRPGQIIAETRWLQVYPDAPSGGYRFAVSVYTYPGPKPVRVQVKPESGATRDQWALIGRSAVGHEQFAPPDMRQPANLDIRLGDAIALERADFAVPLDRLKPGETARLLLRWRALKPMGEGYILFLHLLDATGKQVAGRDAPPFDGVYPTWAWVPGETLVTEHELTVAADARLPLRLQLGMYRYPTLDRLPVMQAGVPQPDNVVIIRPAPS